MFEEIMVGIVAKGVGYAFMVLAGIIMVDMSLGVFKSIKEGNFDIHRLPDYLKTNVLPYLGGLGVLALGALCVQPEFFTALFTPSAIFVGIKYGKEIGEKLSVLFGIKLTTECACCGEEMPYSMSNYEGDPECDKCRTKEGGDGE